MRWKQAVIWTVSVLVLEATAVTLFLLTADTRGIAQEAAIAGIVTAALSPIYVLLATYGRRSIPKADTRRHRRRASAISLIGFAAAVAFILFTDGLGPSFLQVGIFFAIVAWLQDHEQTPSSPR